MRERPFLLRRPVLLGSVLIVIGLVLAIGGVQLTVLGGSPYYLVAGLATLASGVLLWMGDRRGAWLYGAMLVGTIGWAIWESGFDGWALAPRILPPAVLGLWFLIPGVRHKLSYEPKRVHAPIHPGLAGGLAAGLAVVLIGGAVLLGPKSQAAPAPSATLPASATPAVADADWNAYGGTVAGQRFSGLSQITVGNVKDLKVAWTFHTGDLPRDGEKAPREFTYEVTPLKVGDSVFLCTPHNQIFALDAETGKQRWKFDPQSQSDQSFVLACRGVSYYQQPGAAGPCAERIIAATVDARLFAVDAKSGQLCTGFGKAGYVNLLDNMGDVLPGFHYVTSPPTVVNGHVVLGGWINDNQSTNEPSGVIRSFDPVTGALQWAWDMGVPDRIGAPEPGQTYTRDTPNAWSVFSADPALNMVFVPTGNAPPDFYGANRRPFDDKYSSSVVALDLDTGRPHWSFQTTHHDIWDYDVPAQPVLIDVPQNGVLVPAVVQSTKRGELFVLDRRNGQPIFPVTERPVPTTGGVPGERYSPTQPFSAISLLPAKLTEAKMWGVTPIDQMMCRITYKKANYEGIFTPQSTRPVINFPGALGVVDWGSVAVDPDRKLILANSSAVPYLDQLVPRDQAPEGRTIQPTTVKKDGKSMPGANYAWSPQVGTPYVMHTEPFMGPMKVPCTQPPWGFMQAIDLTTGKFVWKRKIGTGKDSGPMNIPSQSPILMGVPNLGGSLVTRGGLVFNGSTVDRYFRAYDVKTGKQLWQARLPAGGNATPMTYQAPSGRQFVVLAAGGHQGMGTKIGDSIIAYALPAQAQ